MHDLSTWIALAGVFALAGLVKGVVGLGLPTVCMALLALWMPPAQAAALLVMPSMVTNLAQITPWRSLPGLLGRIWPMQLMSALVTVSLTWYLGGPAGAWAGILLGLTLVVYGAWGLRGATLRAPRREKCWGVAAGAITGVITAATGVFVIPAVPYLQSLALQRDTLIQAMGVSFSVSTLALAIGLAAAGRYSVADVGASAWMLLPALIGMFVGQRLRHALSPAHFRRVLFSSLCALGIYMLWRDLT